MPAPGRHDLLHVAIVAPSLQQMRGGQEVQGDQLAREWQGDPDICAVLIPSNPALPAALRRLERVPLLRTLLRLPERCAALWRAVATVDVVHVFAGAHTSFLVGSVPALVIAALRRKATLLHYHSPRGADHLARSALARWLLRRCDAVVVPSRYLQEIFARHDIAAVAIANVVDSARFPPRSAHPATPGILSVRNFEHRYAVDDVIRAFALVKRQHPTATLVLVGAGPDERMLRALVDALALPDVSFVGATSRDAVGRLMANGAVLLNASRIDNMPVSILEAFSVGLPVVSTGAGGIPYMAKHGETALLAEVGDVETLARHVVSLLADESLRDRLVAAARIESDGCTWATVRPAWREIYGRLAAARHSDSR